LGRNAFGVVPSRILLSGDLAGFAAAGEALSGDHGRINVSRR